MTIRILIVDDQALLRTGFRMILEAEPDLTVVGEAEDGRRAIEQTARLAPDVVLMDIRMPSMDGLEATRRIVSGRGANASVDHDADAGANPDAVADASPRVIILTTFDLDEYVYDALRAGASGFLLKDAPPSQLIDGIRAVAGGDALIAPSVTRRLIREFAARPRPAAGPPPVLDELTPRELEVLALVARGQSNAEIAAELAVSSTTVKTHVARILMKLDLRDRVQAVVLAYESGLIQPGS
jgi:DNA-binding NarL/FixJ family response regulator